MDVVRCRRCRASNQASAEYCRHCGGELQGSSEHPQVSPAKAPAWQAVAATAASAVKGSRLFGVGQVDAARASGAPVFVGIGAGAVLLGSVLPIAGSMGRRASLFPDVIAQIPEAWLVPISAVLLLVGAALLNSLTDRMLAIVAGLCVAVASPGLVLFIVAASMGRQALDSVGPLSHLIEVGPGGVVLLAGYALALMGGLAALAGIPVSQEGEG